jgi:hypothetical protein
LRLRPPTAAAHAEQEAPVLVGLGPHAEARAYEGLANWDLGFAWLADGRLRYRGEEAEFALSPGQVAAVELVAGAPSWIRTRVVRVRWRDKEGQERAFRLTPLESRRLMGIAPRARALQQRLELWRRAAAPVPAWHSPEASPPTAEITSSSPRDLLTARDWLRLPMVGLLASAAACGLVGAPFWPARGMGFFEVFVTCCLTQAFLMVPLARDRGEETRRAESVPAERAAA